MTQRATVDDAIVAILAACQRHLLANQAAAEDGRDPEGVHQMRVALRQMRTAFSLLRDELGSHAFERFDREARWIARKLGACRDWDVFEAETLVEAKPNGEAPLLRAAAEPRRNASYAALREALAGRRYARFQLALARWIESHGWRDGLASTDRKRLEAPVAKFAASPMSALLNEARKKGKNFDELSLRERHRLRLALKKLRYAAGFFRPLYRKGKVKRFERKLIVLQELLGKDSDMITTRSRLRELAGHAASPLMRRAADALRKRQARYRRGTASKKRRAWQKFKRTPAFW
jgi:CHAD domain-containing protein